MKKIVSLLCLGALPVFANAASVQHEVDGSYSNLDPGSVDAFTVGYTYYLQALETEGAIKNELPFLRRASFGSAELGDIDGENFGLLSGRTFINQDVFVGGSYAFDMGGDLDLSQMSVHAGSYFAENSAYHVALSRDFEANNTGASVGIRSVADLTGNAAWAFGADLSAGDVSEFSDSLSVGGNATYYFSDYTGVGLAMNYIEASDYFGYQFEASHYFNEQVGVILTAGEPEENREHITAVVRARF